MSTSTITKVKLDQEVCADVEKLVRLYTELADLRRTRIGNLYCSSEPQLIWNGNPYKGQNEIQAFWDRLPVTQHEVICLDAHPLDPTQGNKPNKLSTRKIKYIIFNKCVLYRGKILISRIILCIKMTCHWWHWQWGKFQLEVSRMLIISHWC